MLKWRMANKNPHMLLTYISVEYREPFDEMMEDLESDGLTRYTYLKSLVIKDMVRRGALDAKEVRRKDRPLLEL